MEIVANNHNGYFKIFIPFEKIARNINIFNNRTYKCESCCKIFFNEINYKFHKRMHKGEKSFYCTYEGCNRAFISRRNMELHLKTFHSNEKTQKEILNKCKELCSKIKDCSKEKAVKQEKNYELIKEEDENGNVNIYQVDEKNNKSLCAVVEPGVPV